MYLIMYNQKIIEIFKNPMNVGGFHGANGVGKVVEEATNNISKMYLKITEDALIEEARFKAMGNVITIVSSSVATQLITNKKVKEAELLSANDILEVLGEVDADKLVFVELAVNAVKDAINEYKKVVLKGKYQPVIREYIIC